MASTKNIVILSPHIDDELIGCFSLLKNRLVKKVIYFFDLTDERKSEALAVAKEFDFEVSFNGWEELIDDNLIVYAPVCFDKHPHHKAVNLYAKTLTNKICYYSIDMNNSFNRLSEEDVNLKRELLFKFYKSQHTLFNNDEKYYLFEGLNLSEASRKIWVTFQRAGLHRYAQAQESPTLTDVSYLGLVHRHLFKFKVAIEVYHNDRDIEFHQFLNWLESLYSTNVLELDHKSCEMISDDLYSKIQSRHPGRYIRIEISEDGECGSDIEYWV